MDQQIFKNKVLLFVFLILPLTISNMAHRDDNGKGNFEEGHAFIGYQKDTPAAVVFQASKQLKKYRKGLSMSRLSESGILGDIPTEELVKEAKDSDMWKDAVSKKKTSGIIIMVCLIFVLLHPGTEAEPVLAAPDSFR